MRNAMTAAATARCGAAAWAWRRKRNGNSGGGAAGENAAWQHGSGMAATAFSAWRQRKAAKRSKSHRVCAVISAWRCHQ